jgi:site-specific recombinase XerD
VLSTLRDFGVLQGAVRLADREEHGKQTVTAEERRWILFARDQLGDLKKLPDVIQHWRRTGDDSITPTSVADAVKRFLAHQLPEVDKRTQSDIRSRLNRFTDDFTGREMHSIHAADIETWLHGFKNRHTRSSYWKRISPFLAYCHRHRVLAVNPLDRLKAPEAKRVNIKVYKPGDFKRMVEWANFTAKGDERECMLPFLALSGLCFCRTGEIVRLYSEEEVLRWSDILWDRKLVHVRGEVAKETRRENDERFVPFGEAFENVMAFTRTGDARCVELLHSEFSKVWRKMHAELGLKPIHNGMRKSCISYTLAARPELGIVQASKWVGNSEGTIKKHYLERLTQEEAEGWFNVDAML